MKLEYWWHVGQIQLFECSIKKQSSCNWWPHSNTAIPSFNNVLMIKWQIEQIGECAIVSKQKWSRIIESRRFEKRFYFLNFRFSSSAASSILCSRKKSSRKAHKCCRLSLSISFPGGPNVALSKTRTISRENVSRSTTRPFRHETPRMISTGQWECIVVAVRWNCDEPPPVMRSTRLRIFLYFNRNSKLFSSLASMATTSSASSSWVWCYRDSSFVYWNETIGFLYSDMILISIEVVELR